MIETVRRSAAGDAAEREGGGEEVQLALGVRRDRVSPWRRPDRMRGAVLVATLSAVGASWLWAVVAFVAGHLDIAVSWH